MKIKIIETPPTFKTRTKQQRFGLKSFKLPYLSDTGLSSTVVIP